MNEPVTGSVSERITRLERENRRLKRTGAAVLVGLAALAVMGQARPNVARLIETERVVVRDLSGRTRAALGLAPDGSAGLALADANGKLRASLTLALDGRPSLALFDGNEKNRIALVVGPDGASSFALYDRDGESRAGLSVRADGSPEVVLQR